ncbi:bifunctional 4-hydroxy-2-oxoglutarate aldolase/2-dehydro-3-deoxy-phosphogluconate aldolase [Bacillaceae bacterium S4-13-58]
MTKERMLSQLQQSGLVVVIRRPHPDHVFPLIEALVEGGAGALEITMDTVGAPEIIKKVKKDYGDRALVGAGTVLNKDQALLAIEHGADFIFSPSFNEKVVKLTNDHNKISIPGVYTPTEIVNAYEAGADLVKIFPAGGLGPNYIKDLQGPLGHIPMLPTGGVSLDNVDQFIKSGCFGVGVGGSLLTKSILTEQRWDDLKELTEKYISAIRAARKETL